MSAPGGNSEHVGGLLPAYVNGTLGGPDLARVEEHLRDCAQCAAEVASWRAIGSAVEVAAAALPAPPPAVFRAVLAEIDRLEETARALEATRRIRLPALRPWAQVWAQRGLRAQLAQQRQHAAKEDGTEVMEQGLGPWIRRVAGGPTGRVVGLVAASFAATMMMVGNGGLAKLVLVRSHVGPGYYQLANGYYYSDSTLGYGTYGMPYGVASTHTPTATATASPTDTPTATASPTATAPTVPPTHTPEAPAPPAPPAPTTVPPTTVPPTVGPPPIGPPPIVPPGPPPIVPPGPPPSVPLQQPLPPTGGQVMLVLPGGQTALVNIAAGVIADLPANQRVMVVFNPAPAITNEVVAGSLGGGNIVPIGQPFDIRLSAQDVVTGAPAALPEAVLARVVEVRLPVQVQPAAPGQVFQYLRELLVDGQFAGYLRMGARFDPPTNSLIYELSIGDLLGTLFLPVIVQDAWVQNHDPAVHIWSGPTAEAIDYGVAAPQFTTFTVVGPQVLNRIFVHNPVTDNYGWVDVDGVGPAGPPR